MVILRSEAGTLPYELGGAADAADKALKPLNSPWTPLDRARRGLIEVFQNDHAASRRTAGSMRSEPIRHIRCDPFIRHVRSSSVQGTTRNPVRRTLQANGAGSGISASSAATPTAYAETLRFAQGDSRSNQKPPDRTVDLL